MFQLLQIGEAAKLVFFGTILLLEQRFGKNFVITESMDVMSAERLSYDSIKLILSTNNREIQCSFFLPANIPGQIEKEDLLRTSRDCPTLLDSSRLTGLELCDAINLTKEYAENIALFFTELSNTGV